MTASRYQAMGGKVGVKLHPNLINKTDFNHFILRELHENDDQVKIVENADKTKA